MLKPLRKVRQPAITDFVPITRLGLHFLALTAVRPSELRGARWDEFEELNGEAPLWRIPTARLKDDLNRKGEIGGDHLAPLTPQAVSVLKALWPLTGAVSLVFPNNQHPHRPMRRKEHMS